MRFSLRLASSFALLGLLSVACGGSEPPAVPPPTPPAPTPPPAISAPIPTADAGAPAAVETPPKASPSFVAKRQGTIRDLAVDGRWTYWLTQDGDVKRAQSTGGPALKVESFGSAASALVVFEGKMYLSASDVKGKFFSLLRADPNLANKPDVLATQSGTSAFLTADRAHVAWGTVTGKKLSLVVLGPDVKGTTKLEPIDATAPSLLALGPKNACYLDGHDVRTPLLFGKNDPKKLFGFSIQGADIRALGVAGNRVFFATSQAGSDDEHEQIMSSPIEGGVADLVAKDQANVTAFVADENAIYWTARGTKAAGFADGKIMKADGHTNATVTLVENQHAPTKIAVDDDAVTWTNDNAEDNAGDTDVMRLTK